MGIIILPILLGALIIATIAITKSNKLFQNGTIAKKEIIFGLLMSVFLFTIITICYIIEGEVWALGPLYRISITAIILPYVIHILLNISSNQKIGYTSNLILISIGFSLVLGIIYWNIFPDFLEQFGVKRIY